jgi:hypothetical protein
MNLTRSHLLSNKMNVDLDMLGATVLKIGGNVRTEIALPEVDVEAMTPMVVVVSSKV